MSEQAGIFVSSSLKEFPAERQAIKAALNIFGKQLSPWLWEDHATAQDRTIQRVYTEKVDECQIYLGLFGQVYGEYTIEEFQRATALGKPRLVFVKKMPDDEREMALQEFLATITKVETGLTTEWFTDITDLKWRVARAMFPFAGKTFPEWEFLELPRRELFVGREREIADLIQLVEQPDHISLTALEGMGGLGKTHLAREVAHRLANDYRFPGGIFWLNTFGEKVTSAGAALRRLAEAHPIGRAFNQEGRDISPVEVRKWLNEAPGRMLVIADDVWHRAALLELLEALPKDATLLVTTRNNTLTEVGWATYQLNRFPVIESLALICRILEIDEQHLDEAQTALLGQIVQTLDGHALALRLAASWLRREGGLSASERYLERLAHEPNPLQVLQVGEARHENVEKAFSLSFDILNEQQQAIFCATAAFAPASTFSDEALLNVWGGNLSDQQLRWQAEDDLSSLVPMLLTREDDLPLVGNPRSNPKKPRYRLHGLLHAYAVTMIQHLKNLWGLRTIQRRHRDYYLMPDYLARLQLADVPQYRHAFSLTDNAPNFFLALFAHLSTKPFLWDALREEVIFLVRAGETSVIDRVGIKADLPQSQLLISALQDQFPEKQAILQPILRRWLNRTDDQTHAAEIAAQVGIAHLEQNLVQTALHHPCPLVHGLVIQQIHALWRRRPALVEALLESLAGSVYLLPLVMEQVVLPSVYKKLHLERPLPHAHVDRIDRLFRTALLLGMSDFIEHGTQSNAIEPMQHYCRKAVRRLFLATRSGPLERQLKKARANIVRGFVQNALRQLLQGFEEASGQALFSVKDIQAFFPADAERQRIVGRLIPHMFAVTGDAPESLEALADFIEELAQQGDNDLPTAGITLAVLVSHLYQDPLHTAEVLHRLLFKLRETKVYPPTLDPNQPTSGVWMHVTHMALGNVNYQALDRAILRDYLSYLLDISFLREREYYNKLRLNSGAAYHMNCSVDCIWGYELGWHDLGPDKLREFVELFIQRSEITKLRRCTRDLVEAGIFVISPAAALAAIYDLLKHLEEQDTAHTVRDQTFWDSFTHSILLMAGQYPLETRVLIDRCRKSQDFQLPDAVLAQLLNTTPPQNFDFIMMITTILFFRKAIISENPYMREMLVWFFEAMLDAPSLENFLFRSFQHLVGQLEEDLF